ncbi:hypothetical protein HZC07_01195 [Candidatus Micrarchaeota archaeon]|nr:hypothetical protein [Candidatus Micrarchaeota archaeon]
MVTKETSNRRVTLSFENSPLKFIFEKRAVGNESSPSPDDVAARTKLTIKGSPAAVEEFMSNPRFARAIAELRARDPWKASVPSSVSAKKPKVVRYADDARGGYVPRVRTDSSPVLSGSFSRPRVEIERFTTTPLRPLYGRRKILS